MSSIKSNVLNKSNNNSSHYKYNLRDKSKLKKCSHPEPPLEEDMDDSDDSDYTDDDSNKSEDIENDLTESDYSDEDDIKNNNMNHTSFLKTLLNIFPSKYMTEKVKASVKENKTNNKHSKHNETHVKHSKHNETHVKHSKHNETHVKHSKHNETHVKHPKHNETHVKHPKHNETHVKHPKHNETHVKHPKHNETHVKHPKHNETHVKQNIKDEESEEDSEDEDDKSNLSSGSNNIEKNNKCNKKTPKNYIVLNIGNTNDEEYDDNYESEPTDDDDNYECNSEDEQTFMKEKYEKVVELHHKTPSQESEPKTQLEKSNKSKNTKQITNNNTIEITDDTASETSNIESEYVELLELKKQFTEKLIKNPKNKIIQNALDDCKTHISKLIKTARNRNAKYYHKLIYDDNKTPSEVDYFKKKLSNEEQLCIMNELKEINKHINIEKPYRLSILQSKMNPKYKAIAIQKLNMLRSMEPGDPEYYKIKLWVDTFMKIPFNIHKNMSVQMSDGIEVCNHFMKNAKQVLDKCVYGLNDAKMQIMQMMGQWITNPTALGTAIAIHGPPGSGKTSLVKDGISKILGREFSFIALGGSGDSSFLEGHSYTYEGSTWGKIVSILIESKCMNPIIYFDELDKISDTPRGQEIIGVLTHLTDTTQNDHFRDKYFSEIDFDLSKCLFIFSYNDENLINPILKDRMYRIQTKGYDSKEKVIIARDYLLPKIREQVNFNDTDIIIPDDTILYIAGNTALTKNESGVRNLKRCLEIIYTKLNLFRLINSDDVLFSNEIKNMKVSFPFTVTRKEVDIIIKNEESQNQSLLSMYI